MPKAGYVVAALKKLLLDRTAILVRPIYFAVVVLLASLAFIGAASAENYPSHLVRFIVPFPAGGCVDLVIRAAAQELGAKWGVPVIIENRPGAGGTIGT